MESFIYHTDPGHGWVEVPYGLLIKLGIANEISKFSYRKGDRAFLEEDSDATVFADAYTKQKGCKPIFLEKYAENSFMRGLRSY